MWEYTHKLSAFFFYLLGASFFVAWIFLRNEIWATPSAVWLQIGDLPLAFSALVYGGLSLYLSFWRTGNSSRFLRWFIAIPLGIFFIVLLVLNFWR